MGIFNFWKTNKTELRGLISDYLLFNQSTGYTTNKALLLSAVYRCVEVISDSVAQLPLEIYSIDVDGYKSKYTNHRSYRVLNNEPNEYMTRFTFMKTLITSVLLKGNGYAYITRDNKGNAISLEFISSDNVTPHFVKGKLFYQVTGQKDLIESVNMIHILNFSYDGIHGVSTLTHAKNTLTLSSDSDAHASGFFRGGANVAGILTAEGDIKQVQQQAIKSSWQSAFSPTSGTPNGIAILPGNMKFQPITVNAKDAQLLETRQFNVVDICRFFGVSPIKCFDLSKSSYSTVEATQLAFLTDTLAPLLEKIELEFERKIFKPSEKAFIDVRFDTSVLLRADKASLASYYNTLFQIGVISPNEIRRELDLSYIEDGDSTFVQCNVVPIKNAHNLANGNITESNEK